MVSVKKISWPSQMSHMQILWFFLIMSFLKAVFWCMWPHLIPVSGRWFTWRRKSFFLGCAWRFDLSELAKALHIVCRFYFILRKLMMIRLNSLEPTTEFYTSLSARNTRRMPKTINKGFDVCCTGQTTLDIHHFELCQSVFLHTWLRVCRMFFRALNTVWVILWWMCAGGQKCRTIKKTWFIKKIIRSNVLSDDHFI